MNSVTTAKIALALGAVIILGVGIRTDNSSLRWIGIALLAGAFALRFLPKDRQE